MPKTPLREVIRQHIIELRERQGLTQAELAARSGVATPEISKLESGKRAAGLVTLEKLAHGLRVEPWELLREGSPMERLAEAGANAGILTLLNGQPPEVQRRAEMLIAALVAPLD